MPLASTFPALSADDALRELTPCGGDGGRSSSSSSSINGNGLPFLPMGHGHAAGWLSPLPAATSTVTATSLCTVTTSITRCLRPNAVDGDVAGSTQESSASSAEAGKDVGVGGGASTFVRGEILPTSKAIRRGDVVAVERPLVAAQASRTLPWVAACPGCLRHVGGLETQLAVAAGTLPRSEAFLAGSDGASAKATPIPTAAAEVQAKISQSGHDNAAGPQAVVGAREEDGEGLSGNGNGLPELDGITERFARVRESFGEEHILHAMKGLRSKSCALVCFARVCLWLRLCCSFSRSPGTRQKLIQ